MTAVLGTDAGAAGAPEPRHVPLLIGGAAARGRRLFEVRDPGRVRAVVAVVEDGGPEHAVAAVAAAARAAAGWRDHDLPERTVALARAADAAEDRVSELAPLLSRENGGTLTESRMDLLRGTALLRDFLALAPDFLAARTVDTSQHWLSIEKAPVGVVALIVPWNSPMVLTMSKLAPALLAGNTVVVKPSVLAPAALAEYLRHLAELLPPGVLNVVHGDAEAGQALVAHPAVRKVSFTGSVQVGQRIMAAAAANLKKVSLELGGNDAAIVLDDADFETAIPRLCQGAFTRAGQICFAVEQFGPVLPVVPYRDEDEAVAFANGTEYGLASSVWGTDTDRAIRVARRIEAGATFVNSHNLSSLSFDMPFGGVKRSGLGRERTALGLREYAEEHAIRLVK